MHVLPAPKNRRYCTPLGVAVLLLTTMCAASAAGTYDSLVDSILTKMTLRERIGQMMLVYHSPYEFLNENHVGGVLIMQSMVRKPERLKSQLDSIQRKLAVPLLVTIDQEGGTVNRLSPLQRWKHTPSARELATWSADSIVSYWSGVAGQLHDLHINTNLAPVLDPAVNAHGRETFMAARDRSFGNGSRQIAEPASAFARAFVENGAQCVAKHFPGYDAETNSDHDIAVSDADSSWLDSCVQVFGDLRPHIGGVMMSSILYRSVSEKPAVFSPSMVAWAREVLGEVVVMTDDLWGTALRSYMLPGEEIQKASYPEEAFARLVREAVLAGNDMLMITFPQKVPVMIDVIEAQAAKDSAVRDHIDAATRRILMSKAVLGLLATTGNGNGARVQAQ